MFWAMTTRPASRAFLTAASSASGTVIVGRTASCLVGDRGLDQVGGARGIAVGVDVGEVDLEQTRGFLGAELHRLEERGARAAMLDEDRLDRLQVLGERRTGEKCQARG